MRRQNVRPKDEAIQPFDVRIATDLNKPVADLIGKKEVVDAISFERYVDQDIGMPTLLDIAKELVKPGRDPREDGERLLFSDDISTIDDLKIGMKLKGTVSNVTKFGAFVDIGVHQDGLVHISELSAKFVDDPSAQVAVGDVIDVVVIDVDKERKRISLSCKIPGQNQNQGRNNEPRQQRAPQHNQAGAQRAPQGGGQGRPQGSNGSKPFTPRPRDGQQAPRQEFRRPEGAQQGRPNQGNSNNSRGGRDQRDHNHNARPQEQRRPFPQARKEPAKSFSLDDLLNKFNNRG